MAHNNQGGASVLPALVVTETGTGSTFRTLYYDNPARHRQASAALLLR
jgi:hypothetical protein